MGLPKVGNTSIWTPFANFARDSNPAYLQNKNSQTQNLTHHKTRQNKNKTRRVGTELTQASVQYTNKGDLAPDYTEPETNTDTSKLQTESKLTIGDGGYYSTCAPLTVEIVSTQTGLEILEEERQVELDLCLHTLYDRNSSRLCTTKTEVIP